MLMVGEAPSPTSDPTDPILSGRSGRWLRWLLGDHWTRFRERCSFANLVETYPGPRYPLDLARREALRLLSSAGRPRTLLLCGRKVATAFGYGREGFLSAVSLPGERLVFLPHPSGLCRWWNDEGNRSRARDALLSECYRKEAAS
jgi:uracil-DNA glycosylase